MAHTGTRTARDASSAAAPSRDNRTRPSIRQAPANQAVQTLAREATGAGVREGPQIDSALAALGTTGASLGRSNFVARGLPSGNRARILAHEARHTAQTAGRDFDRHKPVRLGPVGDEWERDAEAEGPVLIGADPQVLRRWPGDDEGGVCEADGGSGGGSGSSGNGAGDGGGSGTDAGTCDVDAESVLETSSGPLTTVDSGALSSEMETGENLACEPPPGASFDPEAIDVQGMGNAELNTESIRVDEWTATHGDTSPPDPDIPAYRRLQERLRAERGVRVQDGHLWMTTAVDPMPEQLLMLQAFEGDNVIIEVDQTYAAGRPETCSPGPIMTRQQFEDHLASLGLPILTEDEYIELLRQTAAEIAPELLLPPGGSGMGERIGMNEAFSADDPFGMGATSTEDFFRFHGYTGQQGRLDPLSSSILETYPWAAGNRNARFGEIAEGFALRQWAPHGARGFDSGRLLWNAFNSPRIWQAGSEGDYVRPRGVDWLRPVRRGRDSTPAVDIDLGTFRGGPDVDPILASGRYDALSVKISMVDSPSLRARYGYYLGELSALNDPTRNNLSLFRDLHRPGVPLDEAGSRIALAVPESHAVGLRAFLRDPMGVDASASGGTALTPNWAMLPQSGPRTPDRWEMRSHYATTALSTPFDVGDGGPALSNGAEVLAAHRAGRIDDARFSSLLQDIGDVAAQRVVGFDMSESALGWHQSFRDGLPGGVGRDLRAAFSPEVVDVLEAERRLAGSPDVYTSAHRTRATVEVANRSAVRGAGLSTGVSLGINLLSDPRAFVEDSEYRGALLERTGVELGANYLGDFSETVVRSRVGLMAAEEGLTATAPRLLTGRLVSRALPGVADVIVEGYDIANEDRVHSTTEVVVRTGRAAVIGAGAAYAGAAVGTMIGGPIGFVVGFGVGALVGWLGNKLAPGGREYWEEQEAERRRAAEEARLRREEEERLAAIERARLARLDRPLDGTSASTVGMEGLYGLPVTDPRFLRCDPGDIPTVGELEREYLDTVLGFGNSSSTLH